MTIFKAPDFTPFNQPQKSQMVFLGGSIEMGAAENWQLRIGRIFDASGYIVLDPRRDDWDSTWTQSIENEEFANQVKWELEGLEKANAVILHFDAQTKSPITLLELGLLSQKKPTATFVSCGLSFWRRGNVEIVCDRYRVSLSQTLDEAIGKTIAYLHSTRNGILVSHG